jgi:sulfotransferase
MRIHFIAGLPRSGSTLLASILRQNPKLQASITSPLAEMFGLLLRAMSVTESAPLISDERRRSVLHGVVESYYSDCSPGKITFDTNRGWCNALSAISQLFPSSRVICCVRNPAWIIDSLERLVQRNAFQVSQMFGADTWINVYTRVDALMSKTGLVGASLNAFRQAWYSTYADRLIVIRYESLADQPSETLKHLYEILEEPVFPHDFDNVGHDESVFDLGLRTPGLHHVRSKVGRCERETVLPAELFRYHDRVFWDSREHNPRNVIVL